MWAIIRGLDPDTHTPPVWRDNSYFWESAYREPDDSDCDKLKALRKELIRRLIVHDLSKYTWREARWFVRENRHLRKLTYGSPEYMEVLKRIQPGIQAHYAANRHHPEWHPHGILSMNLADEIEMICDWAAATRKHDDGNILISITKNQDRFGYRGDSALIDFYQEVARACFTTSEWSKILDGSIMYNLNLLGSDAEKKKASAS